ncbi:hypothetical protein BX600DRAFT_532480 [Xylariales sp. PMI_506]|nr:hypothetical protein BX600DRAFT_532480 [Xylariales sp. PMI_506]
MQIMSYHGERNPDQPGLEVFAAPVFPDTTQAKEVHTWERAESTLVSPTSGDGESAVLHPTTVPNSAGGGDKIMVPEKKRALWGIPLRIFLVALAALLTVLAAGIGIGVGVGLSQKRVTTAAASSSSGSIGTVPAALQPKMAFATADSSIASSSTVSATIATTAASTASTATASASSVSMACPDAAGTTYTDPTTGVRFTQQCYVDYTGNDIKNIDADTMEDCAKYCAEVEECDGAVWFNDGAQGTLLNYCWMKTYMNTSDTSTNGDCQSITRVESSS